MGFAATKSDSLFLLPKLKDSDLESSNSGEWSIRLPDTYQTIASGLDLGGASEGQQLRNVTSIPNVWARALLMESAMYNLSYPQRGQLIEQWRGMLAAFALAEVRQFDIKAKPIKLSKDNPDGFARSLYELRPEPTYALYNHKNKENTNPWLDVYVFSWEGRSVGISSPSTLVCHSAEGDWKGLPWFRDNRLSAPKEKDLNSEEKYLLSRWLENIIAGLALPKYRGSDNARSIITDELAKFRDSLGNVPPNIPLSLSTRERYFKESITHGVLELLNQPVKALPKDSSVRLISNKHDAPELMIIDLNLHKQWNLEKHEIYIYEDKTLATKNLISELSNQQKIAWINSEDLFLPELYFFDKEKALPLSLLSRIKDSDRFIYDGKPVTFLLPINELLLNYFSPSELTKKIEINPIDNHSVEITLNFQLSGSGDKTKYYYTRSYSIKPENAITQVPILEIWPNFQAKGWEEYYTFYSEEEKENLSFQVKFPNQQHWQDKDELDQISGSTWHYEWTKLKKFPTHIICNDKITEDKVLGIILLEVPNLINDGDRGTLKVGVDFGTSFTNVYVNKNGSIEKLVLEPLHFSVTKSNEDTRKGSIIEFFMTDVEKILELPLSTVLTTRMSKGRLDDKQISRVRPIFDGCTFIPPDGATAKTQESYINTGLKWSLEKVDRIAAKLFLKHLALKISALAAKNSLRSIEWFISYPSSFSISDQNAYFDIWKDITDELEPVTGIRHLYPETTEDSNHWKSESVAIAQYFADKENEDLVYSTCIDVGGGSSDISIWEDNHLLHQCSIQLAGYDLLTQFLILNPKILENEFNSHNVNWRELKGTKFASELDLLLRRNGSDWLKNNRDTLVANNAEFQKLLQLTCLGVSGLYYYIGIILNALHVEGKYKRGEITPVYLGGNGANLWHWLSEGGRFDNMREINGLFGKMVEKGSNFSSPETRFTTQTSKKKSKERSCVWISFERNDTNWMG